MNQSSGARKPSGFLPQFDDVVLLKEIGSGATSIVYLGEARGQEYAVKVLQPQKDQKIPYPDERKELFFRESSILARTDHPNLVKVFKVSAPQQEPPYMVMEAVTGPSLADKLRVSRFDEKQTLAIISDIASALQHVHNLGLIHRDLKPQNIMFTEAGQVKVIDFGLAENNDKQKSTEAVGTFLYSPPEQTGMLRRNVDNRSDLYSLGVIFYECLTGRLPYNSENQADLLQQHLVAPIPEVRDFRPEVTVVTSLLVNKLLSKDPDDRYQSAQSLVADIENHAELLAKMQQDTKIILGSLEYNFQADSEQSLAGRQDEMRQLETVVEKALGGRGQIVVIGGSPGSGKSRLAREAIYHAKKRTQPIILAAKASMSGGSPLGPFRQAIDNFLSGIAKRSEPERQTVHQRLKDAVGEGATLLKNFCPQLSVLFADAKPTDGRVMPEKFNNSLVDLLLGIATVEAPLIFLMDDLQWIDDSSAHVLKALSSRMRKSHVLLLASVRSNTGQDFSAFLSADESLKPLYLTLSDLDQVASKQLISKYLGGAAIDNETVDQVFVRSRGNPFAVQQFLIALLNSGCLAYNWGTWVLVKQGLDKLNLSDDVSELLLSRTKNISSRSRSILEFASVIADDFDPELLAGVANITPREVQQGLAEALSLHLVDVNQDGQFSFLHDRIREAFISVWNESSLAEVHQKVAAQLELRMTGNNVEIFALARHYGLSPRVNNAEKIFSYNFKAGQLAWSNYAVPEAMEYFASASRALEVQPNLNNPQFEEDYGMGFVRLGRIEEAFTHLEIARSMSKSPVQIARILGAQAYLHRGRGRKDKAWEAINAAFIQLNERPITKNLRLVLWSLSCGIFVILLDKFKGLLRPPSEPEKVERLKVLVDLSNKATYLGFYDLQQDIALFAMLRASIWARQLGLSRELVYSFCDFACTAAVFNRKSLLKFYSEKTFDYARELQDPSILAFAEVAIATARKFNGSDLACEENFRSILPTAARWDDPNHFISGISSFNQVLLRKGYFKEAKHWVELGLNVTKSIELKMELESYRVAIFAGLGQMKDAENSLKTVEDYLQKLGGRSLKTLHMFNKGIYLLEKRNFGPETDKFLNDFYESRIFAGLTPPYARSLLVPGAYIRLNQWLQATPTEKAKARGKLVRAIEDLRKNAGSGSIRVQLEPLVAAHAFALESQLAFHEGDYEKAEQLLELAESRSVESDCHWSLFEVNRTRGQLLRAQGLRKAAERAERAAFNIASTQEWKPRLDELSVLIKNEMTVVQTSMGKTVHGSASSDNVQLNKLNKQMEALLELGLASSKVFGLEAHCRVVMKQMAKLLNPERVFLFLFDKDTGRVTFELGNDHSGNDITDISKYSKSVVETARVTREPLIQTGSDSGGELKSESIMTFNLRSVMAAPLLLQGELLGVVYMDSRVANGIFNDHDLQLLTAFGNHIAIALETTRAAQLELDKKTMAKDLEVVGAVQSLLLPKFDGVESKHFSARTFFRPASEAGGDWWWITENLDGSLRLVVADVTGHGAGSAMVTAMVAGGYQTAQRLLRNAPMEEFLVALNDLMQNSCSQKYWMTFTAVEIDPHKNSADFWFMGSPEFYHAHQKGSSIVHPGSDSQPLGSGELTFVKVTQSISPGDQLIVFTDGLTEFETAQGRMFGTKRLKKLFDESLVHEEIDKQLNYITEKANSLRATPHLDDDMTLALIKFKKAN